MATFHVTAEPAPGYHPDPRTCPLVPVDLMMENVGDAIGWGEAIVTEDAHHIWQSAYAAANPEPERDEDVGPLFDYPLGDTEAADRATAYVDQWQVAAQPVDRPAVNLMPHGAGDPVIRHGVVVFYDSPTDSGTFDVLIDGVPGGHLHRRPDEISGKPAWRIGEATGLLAALADRRWTDYSADYAHGTERWLEGVVLTDIRAALMGRRRHQTERHAPSRVRDVHESASSFLPSRPDFSRR